MAKVTMVFGVLLILLGACAFAILHHGHTLIPAGFGLALIVLGAFANTTDTKRRALFMHVAVTLGLIGFLGTIPGIVALLKNAMGHSIARPDAAKVQTLMGLICFVFVILCVRSFIEARRNRLA